MSAPRELQQSGSDYAVLSANRYHVLPQHMFSGHKSEFRSLLPHRKPTLRLRAPRPPKWHYHIEREYEDLYDPSPTKKKAKLRAARLNLGLIKHGKTESSQDFVFPTEVETGRVSSGPNSSRSQYIHMRAVSSRGGVSNRCGDVISRAESLLAAEKENTSKILQGYKRRSHKRIANNAEVFSEVNHSRPSSHVSSKPQHARKLML